MLLRSSSFLGGGLLSALVLAPAVASAHMRVIDPPPRSNADNLKTGGPCGGIPNAGAKKTYFGDMAASPAGGQIKVDFQETVAPRLLPGVGRRAARTVSRTSSPSSISGTIRRARRRTRRAW